MKHWILLLFIVVFIGCGDEQPLAIIEDEEQAEDVGGNVREVERSTTIVYTPDNNLSGMPTTSRVVEGKEKVIVYRDGMIQEVEIHFQSPRFYWIRGTFEPAEGIWKDEEQLYFNVLDNNILPRPTDEEREQMVAEFRKERGIAKGEPLGIDDRLDLDFRIFHNSPFWYGDEIEVVIKHRGKVVAPQLIIPRERRIREEIEMVFVDVIRNLTRPHIEFK